MLANIYPPVRQVRPASTERANRVCFVSAAPQPPPPPTLPPPGIAPAHPAAGDAVRPVPPPEPVRSSTPHGSISRRSVITQLGTEVACLQRRDCRHFRVASPSSAASCWKNDPLKVTVRLLPIGFHLWPELHQTSASLIGRNGCGRCGKQRSRRSPRRGRYRRSGCFHKQPPTETIKFKPISRLPPPLQRLMYACCSTVQRASGEAAPCRARKPAGVKRGGVGAALVLRGSVGSSHGPRLSPGPPPPPAARPPPAACAPVITPETAQHANSESWGRPRPALSDREGAIRGESWSFCETRIPQCRPDRCTELSLSLSSREARPFRCCLTQ